MKKGTQSRKDFELPESHLRLRTVARWEDQTQRPRSFASRLFSVISVPLCFKTSSAEHGYLLTPVRYVGAEEVEDDGEKMEGLTRELTPQFHESSILNGPRRWSWSPTTTNWTANWTDSSAWPRTY